MDSFYRERHSVIVCPICAKAGNGRGNVQSYYHSDEVYCLHCVTCGWKGDYETCQTYQFPCRIYQTVEMDLSVLTNIFSMAVQSEERLGIRLYAAIGETLEFVIGRETWRQLDDGCSLKAILCWLVSEYWLFPAVYKVKVDV